MAVVPTGVVGDALATMRATLAASIAFQVWIGVPVEDQGEAAGVTAALARIHYVVYEDGKTATKEERQAARPLALVDVGDRLDGDVAVEGAEVPDWTGAVTVVFHDEADAVLSTEAEQALQFINDVGGIVEDLFELQGASPYITLTDCHKLEGPTRYEETVKNGLTLYDLKFGFGWSNI